MKLIDIRHYLGRNIYSHCPVVRIDVDLGKYVDIPTCDIEGFNDSLLKHLPGLKKHCCSVGREGGFVERLERGTYLAHVIEHSALEIQNMLGYDLSYGKARYLEKETIYYIIYSYEDHIAGLEAGKLAFELIKGLLNHNSLNLEEHLQVIKDKIQQKGLGPSTAAIIEEARKLRIPVIRIGENSLFQLGYGKSARRIQATITDRTSCLAVDCASDKELTKEILNRSGIPVPLGKVTEGPQEAVEAARELGYPVVVKPYNGNQGKGVSIDLRSSEEVEKGFYIAKAFSDKILVEEYVKGKHYRIAVVGEKVVAVAQRLAAHVVGNGKNTIRELIERENQNPLRGYGHEKPLTKIKIDEVMSLLLEKTNKSLEDIPQVDEVVLLRENANLSTGGTAIDVTDDIDPENVKLAVAAAKLIGLDVAGIDITTPDISLPLQENGGAVIEVNACPGIRMHHFPSQGKARNVAREIVEMLFPEGKHHSIPIISVTGTNGKTTTTRMLGKMIKNSGIMVGMTTTGGIYIGDELILKGDTTGPKSAQTVLMDQRVEAAVLETARGGIVNRGLGYDMADVGIITNVADDHLGIDGINTLEEMAHVKGLVVEAVKKEGWAILNADDPYTPEITKGVRCNLIYYGMDYFNPLMVAHIKNGGTAVYVKKDFLYLYDGKIEHGLLAVKEIAASYGGLLKHNIQNSMAAVAGAYGIGLSTKVIVQTLKEFNTDVINNPGRFNLFDFSSFKVIIDYGHNIDGYSNVLDALKGMKSGRLVGIIGVPGDRTDINILKLGELSGKYFDQVYIKEDKDSRGRSVEEVARLLKKGCTMAGMAEEKIIIELCEVQALEMAMNNACEGDIIIVFYEELEPLVKLVEAYRTTADIVAKKETEVSAAKLAVEG